MSQARKKTEPTVQVDILRHIKHGLRESGFLLLIALAIYLTLCLASFNIDDPAWTHTGSAERVTNLGGVAGAWFADIALYFFGYFAYAFPLGVMLCGWMLFKRGGLDELDTEIVLFRSLGFLVALVSGCGLASLHLRRPSDYLLSSAGGILGDVIGQNLIGAFSFVGGTVFLLALFLAGITLATGLSWVGLMDFVGKLALDIVGLVSRVLAIIRSRLRSGSKATATVVQMNTARTGRRVEPVMDTDQTKENQPEQTLEPIVPREHAEPVCAETEPSRVVIQGRNGKVEEPLPVVDTQDEQSAEPAPSSRTERPELVDRPRRSLQSVAPPLELLDPVKSGRAGYTPETLEEMSRQVETLLRHFGIEVQVVAVEPGPVITRFEVEPAPGVKVSQISNLAKDLARGLSVISVRVVEVIPGKSVVGLEIPNQSREIVYLSEVLNSPVYSKSVSPLTLALGKDIGGNPVVANLARMPHLLVAGTTGAGKSVAVNAMLLSMLYKANPQEVRLILVDPKMLELSIYEGIPHLLAPVVTDMKEAANALRWCVAEMERRYQLMAALKVRNISGFNQRVSEAIESGQPIPDPLYKPEEHVGEAEIPTLELLPFIVVVIDELADMMMIVGKKVEELIARLAQKARASGIHLILATQRPSVDVITGLIKANIPTRIAFQVSSKVDSRTILDQMGAEQLLGHGDMLYLPPGTGFPQRVHGAFVDDHEVNRVVEFLKQSGEPEYMDTILQEPAEGSGGGFVGADGGSDDPAGESDPLYDQAVQIVTESRRASISGVQRRLKIGYNRAARMIEEMEMAGVVGPLQANGSREVLAPPPPEG